MISWFSSVLPLVIVDPNDWSIVSILGILLLSIAICYGIISNADNIINILKLDKGFDSETIVIGNLNTQQLLQVGIILLAGSLIIYNFFELLSVLIILFKSNVDTVSYNVLLQTPIKSEDWIIPALSVIMGYLLLSHHVKLAKWLDKKQTATTS